MVQGIQGPRNIPSQNANQPENAKNALRVGSIDLPRYQKLVDAILDKKIVAFSRNLIENRSLLTDQDEKLLVRWAKAAENESAYNILKGKVLSLPPTPRYTEKS